MNTGTPIFSCVKSLVRNTETYPSSRNHMKSVIHPISATNKSTMRRMTIMIPFAPSFRFLFDFLSSNSKILL